MRFALVRQTGLYIDLYNVGYMGNFNFRWNLILNLSFKPKLNLAPKVQFWNSAQITEIKRGFKLLVYPVGLLSFSKS